MTLKIEVKEVHVHLHLHDDDEVTDGLIAKITAVTDTVKRSVQSLKTALEPKEEQS